MSQKKKKTTNNKDWTKFGSKAVIIIVLLACFLGFGLGVSNLAGFFNTLKSGEVGDIAYIGYTIVNPDGTPVLTSDQSIAQQAYEAGIPTGLAQQMAIEIGMQKSGAGMEPISEIEAYIYPGGMQPFALFSWELDAISAALEGSKANEILEVPFNEGTELRREMTEDQYNKLELGVNFSEIPVGALIPLGFTSTTYIPVDNQTIKIPIRWAKVIAKTDGNITVDYSYLGAQVTVTDIQ